MIRRWLLSLGLACAPVLAQCPPVQPGPAAPAPEQFYVGPGREVLRTLWELLGLSNRLGTLEQHDKASDLAIDCARPDACNVEVVADERLSGAGRDAVILVCQGSGGGACRFLLLHNGPRVWRLVDYVDWQGHYGAPSAEIVASVDRRWLVITGSVGGGTGVGYRSQEWFELHCGRLRHVLQVPESGYDVNAEPSRYFSTRFRRYQRAVGKQLLEFSYVLRFEDYDQLRELWQEERTVTFARGTSGKYQLDAARSELTARQVQQLFAYDSLDRADFLRFGYQRLMSITAGRDSAKQAWLRRYLETAPRVPEVRRLRQALLLAGFRQEPQR